MDKWKRALWLLGILIAAALIGLPVARAFITLISKRPDDLGVQDGQLKPCPSSPNCVSSQSEDETHSIAPIPYTVSTDEAQRRILDIIRGMERSHVVTAQETYIHAEFTTPGFHYIDDVEFYFDEEAGLIHFRSAARLPYYDFNVNRERMEQIRHAFENADDS